MADDTQQGRVKVTALLRPEIKEKLKARADANDRDMGHEAARIIAERIKADEAAARRE